MSHNPQCEIHHEPTTFGQAFLVLDKGDLCSYPCFLCDDEVDPDNTYKVKELHSTDGKYPAIPVYLNDDNVELRSGSEDDPIPLMHLQSQSSGSFKSILVQDDDGVIYRCAPSVSCLDKRLVIVNGRFDFQENVLPTVLDYETCEANNCSDFAYYLGVKKVTLDCNGVDKLYYKLVLVPKEVAQTC